MRNQRSNFIPLPTKPAKSTPKPLPKAFGPRRSSSSQTERVVLIKEENLNFYPCSRFGHNDGGMRRDYIKAVNYINSCHKFINTIIEKNSTDKNNTFTLPMISNFAPLFPYLTGKRFTKKKEPEEIKKVPEKKTSTPSKKSEDRKSKSSFGVVKKEEKAVISSDSVPVGDCQKNVPPEPQQATSETLTTQMTDIVKEEIHQFLNTLQQDMNRASRKSLRTQSPKQKCKNLDIVKDRLVQLSKICSLQKNIQSNPQIPTPPIATSPPQTKDTSEDCSTILSDTDCEETKKHQSIKITCYGEEQQSLSSLTSGSSYIKSDSDIEINGT